MNYITVYPALSTAIKLEGYNFDYTQYVLLSANDNTLFPYVCCINFFTGSKTLSSALLPVSGYPINSYTIQGQNKIVVYLSDLTGPVKYDVIIGNVAGYGKLSDRNYLIDALPPPETPAFYAVAQGGTVPVAGSDFYVLSPDAVTNFNVSGDGYTYNVNIISEGEYSYAIVTLTNGEQYTAQLNTLTTIMIDGIERTVYLTYFPNGGA